MVCIHKFVRYRGRVIPSFVIVCLLALSAVLWPLDVLEVAVGTKGNSEGGAILLRMEALPGREMVNTIIHSVQLTPVVDIYRVQEGRIWSWQEKTRSYGAGLPSTAPERGRFLHEPPWMIVEGGGMSWSEIPYRVGTKSLGRNELCVFGAPCKELWREVPGKRLVIRVTGGPVL